MISAYVRQSEQTLRRWALDPGVQQIAKGGAHVLAGFCLSAASLEQGMLPLVMGLVWACRGWRAVLVAAGGCLGYGLFWGAAGIMGLTWTGLALLGVLLLGDRRICREAPLLIPAAGMLMVSAVGLGFQLLAKDATPVLLHLIRVALGGAAPWLFIRWQEKRTPVTGWFCWGFLTLGLAQMLLFSWLGLGYMAAGGAVVLGAFPCAAITGLALDLAGITPVPMTAITVLAWCIRFLPRSPRWVGQLAPGCVGMLVLYASGQWDLLVLPGLFLGGIIAGLFARKGNISLHRGETGVVQVRLELAAQVLERTCRLLEEVPQRLADEDGLVQRAVGEACAGCSARSHCRDMRKLQQLPGALLKKPLLTVEELPVRCKKSGRVLVELRRGQEQLRTIQADRMRQAEYRAAVVQQYGFLSRFLQTLSNDLGCRSPAAAVRYDPVVLVCGNRPKGENGDRCIQFTGLRNRYYIILCDGMGTGSGAIREGNKALQQLQQMISCGFPAAEALESLNSLCALRDRPAAVTVDLAEIELDTGKIVLYKWGAAASYLVGPAGAEKLGSPSVPPGLAAADYCRQTCTVLLKRSHSLLLVSDGVEEETVLRLYRENASPAALAEALLKTTSREDDATVVTIRLLPVREKT